GNFVLSILSVVVLKFCCDLDIRISVLMLATTTKHRLKLCSVELENVRRTAFVVRTVQCNFHAAVAVQIGYIRDVVATRQTTFIRTTANVFHEENVLDVATNDLANDNERVITGRSLMADAC